MKDKQIEEMKNNARIYIGATVEKLRMDGCELWEIDGIVENILNYITVSEDSIILTNAEKQKLLHEMYEQGRFDALADLEKEGKVVMSREELENMVNAKIKCINDMAIITQKKTAESLLSELYYIARFYYGDSANVLAWAKDKAKSLGVEIKE